LHLTQKGVLYTAYLAATPAGSAGFYRAFIFGAIATTGLASDIFFYFDFLLF
jgi:hypothetical protein